MQLPSLASILSHPAFIITLAALVGAIAWRGRGGWYRLGSTQASRVLGILPLLPFAWWAGDLPAAIAALFLFPPLMLGWAEWQDMGTVAQNDDFVGMTGRGFIQVALTSTVLHPLVDPDAGLAFLWIGALMGVVYWLAMKIRYHVKPIVFLGRDLVDGFTSIAELVFGAVLYAGFVLSVLYGGHLGGALYQWAKPVHRYMVGL